MSSIDYLKSAALLGILNSNNEVVIESKPEEDALYDFSIYGKKDSKLTQRVKVKSGIVFAEFV